MTDKIITTWWSYEDVTMNEEDNTFEEFLQETGIYGLFRQWVVRSYTVNDMFDLLDREDKISDKPVSEFMDEMYESFVDYVYSNPEEYGIITYDAPLNDDDIDE